MKPVLAFGAGLFSENNVFLEAKGDVKRLPEVLSHEPSERRARWFMSLLMRRHIPYKIDLKDVEFYPELNAMIRQCKELAR